MIGSFSDVFLALALSMLEIEAFEAKIASRQKIEHKDWMLTASKVKQGFILTYQSRTPNNKAVVN